MAMRIAKKTEKTKKSLMGTGGAKRKLLSLILPAAVAITLLSALLPITALAGGDPDMALGTSGIRDGGTNWVYYGEYGGSPVKWRVLDANNDYDDTKGGTQSALFLLSEYLLDENSVSFGTSNAWQGSTAQDWCETFYSSNFDTAEQSAIAATSKTDSSYTPSNSKKFAASTGILNNDKVFFLSGQEAESQSYGFSSDSDRIARVGSSAGNAGEWWLRSPCILNFTAGITASEGYLNDLSVSLSYSARPAFNLDLSSVLFSSAAEGGKSSGAVGANALIPVPAATPTDWKLTLTDSSRSFAVTETKASGAAGSSVTLNYTNATTGTNEYISAMLVDIGGNVVYYGRIKATTAAGDANGTADITIPSGLASGSYTLKLFSEQYNGDYETDYASAFSNVDLTVGNTFLTLGTSGIRGGSANWVYYGEYGDSPVKWRVLDANNDYDDKTGGTQSALFLLSEYLLDENSVSFGTSNAWQGSTAQDWCETFYGSNFDTAEQSAIAATSKTDSSYKTSHDDSFAASTDILNNDKVFFLSAQEAATSSYGFSSLNDRIARSSTGNSSRWWLRSPDAIWGFVGYMPAEGDIGDVFDTNGADMSTANPFFGSFSVRPALNLKLSSVLFSSAAEGGKSSGAVGANALKPVPGAKLTEWKLTLMDSSRSFTVTEAAAPGAAGSSVTLNYTNATTGTNEYISAMLVDGTGNVPYYGRIKATTAAGDANGTLDVTIPSGLAPGSYTLKLFSEQYNGDYETDYASAFSDVALTVTAQKAIVLQSATADGAAGTTTSTKIDLTFDTAITGLTASNITISDGSGAVVKGALTGSGTSWSIGLVSVTTPGNVSVAVTAPSGYTIYGSPKTVAVYKANGGSGDVGGGGGGSNTPPVTTPVTTKTESTSGQNTTTATTTATATVDNSGKAVASVTQAQVNDAVNKAVAEAAKQGSGTAAVLEIKVTADANAKMVEASLPKAAVDAVAGSNTDALIVSTPIAAITFDNEALDAISGAAAAEVKISAARVDTGKLNEQTRQVVGDRPVFNFSVTSGNKTISQFNGNVTVTVPYTPKPGEKPGAIVIYYINAQGKPEIVRNCKYNPVTGTVTFKTKHLSQYAVGYNAVAFKDVAANVWYSEAVDFIAARGITTGTGNGTYSPTAKLTRGQLLVMVMKAYGIEADTDPTDNFADAGNTYYTGYLAAAKRLGIVGGVGNNLFAPEKEITREEMFTLLYNALKVIVQLPGGDSGKTLPDFTDAGQVDSWAKDAITLLVETGTVGGNAGKLTPLSTTTRAEMAQVLYNLLWK